MLPKWAWSGSREQFLHCGLRKFRHSKSSVYRWYTQLDRRRFVYDAWDNGSRLGHIMVTALFPGLPRWAETRKVKPIWILLKQETVSGSGISWATCKSAPFSRQKTTPAPHHSVFYRPDALPAAQPTASKHWRQIITRHLYITQTWLKLKEAQWWDYTHTHTWDYPGRPLPKETFTHSHPSWSSAILYQLPLSTTIYSILFVHLRAWQTSHTNSLQALFGLPLGLMVLDTLLHTPVHTYLNQIFIFFLQHMPIPSQPVLH